MNTAETGELPTHDAQFPGFFRAPGEWEDAPDSRAYRHHLQRAWDTLELSAVLCVEGRPTAYFKKVEKADLKREAEWHKLIWNQGMAALLVVEDPIKTRVYSTLSKPGPEAATDEDHRLAEQLETAAFALEFSQFLFSVQTGQFYRDRPEKFRADSAVDEYLLSNLSAARDELVAPNDTGGLPPDVAHGFLGRCLFTCYLIERGVVGQAQLQQVGAPIAGNLRRVLEQTGEGAAVGQLFRLFRLLEEDFNGSMFGGEFSTEQSLIHPCHVATLRRFLTGEELRTGQKMLPGFDLYDFRFIPIELISAIYEDFLVGRDRADPNGAEGEQRKVGAYYTPPRLAELVVDIATEGWETLLDKRCLDPACGSGVFLVILFQRMAAEWRRRHSNAGNLERARELRNILTQNLRGVDVDPTACMVACFSLYLAFLDQLEPRDIWALKEALEVAGEGKVLPLLHGRPSAGDADCPVLLEANFFCCDAGLLGQFDLVIGNPPWVGRNQPEEHEMKAWLFDEPQPRNPFLREAPKSKTRRTARFLPQNQSAVAFMWKIPLHLKSNGIACLLLPSRVILSNQTDEFQDAWFRRFSVDAVWQLADYRFILFKSAVCPAIVVKVRPAEPILETAEIAYYTPKVDRLDPRRASVLVSAEDRKLLPLADLLVAAAEDRAYMFWKMPFWGTDRDQRLLDRLRRLPRLGELAGEPGQGKRWVKGQGFKPWNRTRYESCPAEYGEPRHRWWKDSTVFLNARQKDWGIVLLDCDCAVIGPEPRLFHRLPSKEVFTAPLVLANQGCSHFAFSDFDVLFQHSLHSIAGSWEDEDLLLFLTALLNSPLATYYLFHTSANWGVERDKVHFEELLRLPFPLPEQTKNPITSREIICRVGTRLREARNEMAAAGPDEARRRVARDTAADDVSEMVYQFFGLSKWERALVEETCDIFEPSSTPGSLDSKIPTLETSRFEHRKSYADLLCQTINRWARRSQYALVPSSAIAEREGLALLTLVKTKRGGTLGPYCENSPTATVRRLIERVARASVREGLGGLCYLRGFALFEDQQAHILKPLARRHWTRTAALNDADELAEYIAGMEQNE